MSQFGNPRRFLMMNKLDQLKQMTLVVADTGDLEAIKRYQPQDATTNPSLLLKSVQLPQYQPLLQQARESAQRQSGDSYRQLHHASDMLAVSIGREILQAIPGRVSTEIDARLSFDTQATVDRARYLIELYQQQGIASSRVLIKIAATWEGIRAASILEQQHIQCNLTLVFSFAQAVACAEAGVYLISPFVGRILDWHLLQSGRAAMATAKDPGVQSVTRIYNYYKQHHYSTVVMGASFRNTGQIERLAGCDRLTISPPLMQALTNDSRLLFRSLDSEHTGESQVKLSLDQEAFLWLMNEDAMATEKLSEGIRHFIRDQEKLEQLLMSCTMN
jgi:transaldolase